MNALLLVRRIVVLLLLAVPAAALAAESGYRLDTSPHELTDTVSLQSGARTYMNYCLGCHGLQYMRYSGLRDIGLSDAQIRDNLMFTADKVGEPIKAMLPAKESKAWFGVQPPDLSVIARSRGADWLYTYLRTFYRDPKTATGWNNAVFPNVGMPHVLWPMQGQRGLELIEHKDGAGHVSVERKWTEVTKGSLSGAEYDAAVRDLVNFLVYVSEPAALKRRAIGIIVLFVLSVVFIFAYLLKKEYWKDVK
jgi:ubiquinol-cytochrome c reductase cytochrome c1 subunit